MNHPPSSYGIWFYCDCAPPTISLWLLLCLWLWGIFFGEFQCLPVDDFPAVSCDSGTLTRGVSQIFFEHLLWAEQCVATGETMMNNFESQTCSFAQLFSRQDPCISGTFHWVWLKGSPINIGSSRSISQIYSSPCPVLESVLTAADEEIGQTPISPLRKMFSTYFPPMSLTEGVWDSFHCVFNLIPYIWIWLILFNVCGKVSVDFLFGSLYLDGFQGS